MTGVSVHPQSVHKGVEAPSLSVVVPVRNDEDGTERCVAALRAQDVPLEILVVDDGSTDGSGAVAASFGVRVLQSHGRGAAAARNAGIRAASGSIVLFTDADCAPDPGWARVLAEPIARGDAVATKGTYRTCQKTATARFVQLEYEERYRRMLRRRTIDFLDTYSLAVRRDDLVAIGGFDEAFPGACIEDQEMSCRLEGRGDFLFVPEAVVEHRHASTPRGYLRKKLRIGRGKATLLRRHPRRLRSDSHTPDTLRLQVGLLLLAPIAALAAIWLPALAWLAVGLVATPIGLSLPLVVAACQRHGIRFVPAATFLVLGRGWALSAGLAWGAFHPCARVAHPVLLDDSDARTPEEESREAQSDERKEGPRVAELAR